MIYRRSKAASLLLTAACAALAFMPAPLSASGPEAAWPRGPLLIDPRPAPAGRITAKNESIAGQAPLRQTQELTPTAFLPFTFSAAPPTCPAGSSNTYIAVPYEGGTYKDNRLTDQNADFRLSILGYAPASAPLSLVIYAGTPDSDAPRLHGIFEPNRAPDFAGAYQVYGWNWDESAPPPYGQRGPVSTSWPATVIDFATTPGETLQIPERDAPLWADGSKAIVLYAGEQELTLVYMRADQVVLNGAGYVVHLLGLCVDPNLLALYRAQLDGAGRRATGQLPALRNDQPIGTAFSTSIAVAIRDGGAYMDPRSERDWWRDHPPVLTSPLFRPALSFRAAAPHPRQPGPGRSTR